VPTAKKSTNTLFYNYFSGIVKIVWPAASGKFCRSDAAIFAASSDFLNSVNPELTLPMMKTVDCGQASDGGGVWVVNDDRFAGMVIILWPTEEG